MVYKKTKDLGLKNCVALVTGGSKGIGFVIAEALAMEGVDVAICGREKNNLEKAVKTLKKINPASRGYMADSNNPEDVKRVLDSIKRDFKRLDILVNNIGGVRQFSNFEGLTDGNWQEVFDTNIMSMVRFSRVSFPLLRESGKGRIINIASVAGKRPGNFNPHYGAMKAAMIHLSKYLSNQWARYKILVNAVCPHTVKTGVWQRDVANKARIMNLSLKEAERLMLKEVMNKSPLNQICLPEDVANLVVFLASDKAKFITGSCLMLDGGVVNSIF